MKRFISITALAMIAAIAVISCTPEVEASAYDWTVANERNKPENTTTVLPPSIAGGIAAAKNPQIVINFPAQADILKNVSLQALNKFLTVHTYTNPTDTNWTDLGKTSILSAAALPYKFISQNGNSITIELDENFLEPAGRTYSNLIVKFSGQAYTYSGGMKLDVDGDKVSGEAGYDDLYIVQSLTGATVSGWMAPGNKGWRISLNAVTPGTWTGDPPITNEVATCTAATLNLAGISTVTDEGKAVYKKIAESFAGSIKLQKLNGTAWTDVQSAVYDKDVNEYGLVFKNLTYDHDSHYRIKWSGKANLATADSYFGVKQKMYVSGNTPTSSDNKERYSWIESFSAIAYINNTNVMYNWQAPLTVTIDQIGYQNYNVVLRVEFPLRVTGIPADPYAGLVEVPESKFISGDGFKIVYLDGNSVGTFYNSPNLIRVGITGARYAAEGMAGIDVNTAHKNVIYLTLDPNYQYTANSYLLSFLINDTFKYVKVGTESLCTLGDTNNYLYGKYRQFNPTMPAP